MARLTTKLASWHRGIHSGWTLKKSEILATAAEDARENQDMREGLECLLTA